MAQKVIILKGLAGSGKSTWAKKFIRAHPDYKRVCRDDLRLMLDAVQFNERKEKFITKAEHALILQALNSGFNVVVDATHLNPKNENAIRKLVEGLADIEIKSFLDVSVQQCIENDARRENGVGEEVIRKMAKKYNLEDVLDIPIVQKTTLIAPEHNPDLPDAVICDIDGTLALHPQRSHYDYTKVSTDLPNILVQKLLKELVGENRLAIVVSGREDFCREDTEKWLDKYEIPYMRTHLFMRKAGDHRADNIIKKEIFEEHIRGKYNVLWVLDDRDRVVQQWRELGLVCLQVAEGNF